MLKRYAAARRKYEIGKGFTIDKAIAQVVSIGLDVPFLKHKLLMSVEILLIGILSIYRNMRP